MRTPSEAEYIMRKIHEGICEDHAGGQSLAFKILRQDYYWPTMKADCMKFSRKYDRYQRFVLISKAHPKELTIMTNPRSFEVWGIDLIGQLPKGRESVQYAMAIINYFTKWVEAKILAFIMP